MPNISKRRKIKLLDKLGVAALVFGVLSCIGTYLALVPENGRLDFWSIFNPSERFTVNGSNWQNTGLYVTTSQRVEVSYESGTWSNCGGCPFTDANGVPDSSPSYSANVVFGCYHGALIARIVENVQDTSIPIGQPDALEGRKDIVCIGNYFAGSFFKAGYVQFASNDTFAFDNSGSLRVKVVIR